MSSENKQQESSSSVENESAEIVPKEELNQCKRKLEEAKAELDVERKKMKQLVASADIKIRPKRARISLTLPNFASRTRRYHSDPVEIAGFQWKLGALRHDTFMYLFLDANPPANYKGPFQIEVDCIFRFLNTFTSNDINDEQKDQINRDFRIPSKSVEIEDLLEPSNGFLQADGSIQIEVDFTVKAATLDHLLSADPAANNGDNVGSSAE